MDVFFKIQIWQLLTIKDCQDGVVQCAMIDMKIATVTNSHTTDALKCDIILRTLSKAMLSPHPHEKK